MSKRLRVSTEIISGIYEIVNMKNGHRYIGSSKDIYGRWVRHQGALKKEKHHCGYLQNAWKLYGKASFEFRILEKTTNDTKTLFEREQYWYDYYMDSSVSLYNVSPIVISPTHTITLNDLQQGRCKTSYNQFVQICDLLTNTNLRLSEIAEMTNCCVNQIRYIYSKEYFSDLTKEMNFKIRQHKGEYSVNAKLTEKEVIEIAKRMTQPFYTTNLATEYGVKNSTIDDIRHKRTWKELTEGMVFANPIVPVNGRKPVVQYDMDGNFIAEYESAYEAERITGIGHKLISRVCNGDRPHTHGFIFKFTTILD